MIVGLFDMGRSPGGGRPRNGTGRGRLVYGEYLGHGRGAATSGSSPGGQQRQQQERRIGGTDNARNRELSINSALAGNSISAWPGTDDTGPLRAGQATRFRSLDQSLYRIADRITACTGAHLRLSRSGTACRIRHASHAGLMTSANDSQIAGRNLCGAPARTPWGDASRGVFRAGPAMSLISGRPPRHRRASS